jgi:hypothetical protein
MQMRAVQMLCGMDSDLAIVLAMVKQWARPNMHYIDVKESNQKQL